MAKPKVWAIGAKMRSRARLRRPIKAKAGRAGAKSRSTPSHRARTPATSANCNSAPAAAVGMWRKEGSVIQSVICTAKGGGKFGVKDGLAAALAVVGDAFANQAGMQPVATGLLAGGRMDAM